MFGGAFAPRYFPPRYFPGAQHVSLVKPGYFYHGYFASHFFADRYFPGQVASAVAPPTPTPAPGVFGGSVPFIRPAPPVEADLDLVLPVPIFRAFGFVTPADIQGSGQFVLTPPVHAGQLASVVQLALAGELPPIECSAMGTAQRPHAANKRSRSHDFEEENALLEHYLLMLNGQD